MGSNTRYKLAKVVDVTKNMVYLAKIMASLYVCLTYQGNVFRISFTKKKHQNNQEAIITPCKHLYEAGLEFPSTPKHR